MRESVRALNIALGQGRERIVCQVVETKGSTPQKAGALMIVNPDGGQIGTLGGGCVENEVKTRAIRRIGNPGAEIQSFVLDHDYAWADGLICGGKMVIIAQSTAEPDAPAYFQALETLMELGHGFTEAVAIDPSRFPGMAVGARFLYAAEGKFVASWNGDGFADDVALWIAPLDERPHSGVKGGIALLPRLPRVRLVIVGAGHVGQAVANLAAQADFDVWIVDDRAQYANHDRFPAAERLLVGPIEDVLGTLEVDRNTYALVVTRGHGHDQEAVRILAPTAASYVGLIGSRRKIKLIFESLREMGIPESSLARVSAPVGIDIGSESVIEIAVSIVAELISRRNLGNPPDGSRTHPLVAAHG